jgi:hypothetical protein
VPGKQVRCGEREWVPRYAGNIRAVAGFEVREAVRAGLPQIAAVALATGQDEECPDPTWPG